MSISKKLDWKNDSNWLLKNTRISKKKLFLLRKNNPFFSFMKIKRLRLMTRYIPLSGPKSSQNRTSMPSCRAMRNGSRVPQRFTSLLPTFERFSAFIVSPPADGDIANSEWPYCSLALLRYFFGEYFLFFSLAIQ